MSEENVEREAPANAGGFSGPRSGDHINIGKPTILAGISGYAADAQDDLLWLHGYAIEVLHGSRSALVGFVGVDWTTITRIWSGKYGADIAQFLERIRHLRRKVLLQVSTGFVETVATRKIWTVLDMARNLNAVVMITGPSGSSKTHTVKEWHRRNNHGRTTYVDCPVSGGLRALLEAIAEASGNGKGRNNNNLSAVLERSFDYRNTIILDEVARLLQTTKASNVAALEFVRRLHDVSGCGIVLVATEVFSHEMRSGRMSAWFEQLLGRIEHSLVIPRKVSKIEVTQICQAYCGADVVAPPDLVALATSIANGPGRVRMLFALLRHASTLARQDGASLSRVFLQAAKDLRDGLNQWPEE